MTAGPSSCRFDRLTEAQRACLRLVYRRMTSKDIARELGVTHHAVDMRLRHAMQTLSVHSRVEAARLFAEFEGRQGLYQSSVYQSPDLADGSGSPILSPPTDEGEGHRGPLCEPQFQAALHARSSVRDVSAPYEDEDVMAGWPLPRRGGRNDLSGLRRLGWIMAIAIGSALGVGAILASLEALGRLL